MMSKQFMLAEYQLFKIEPNPEAEYKETLEQGGTDELSERK